MRRLVYLAVAGIALLGAAAVLIIHLASGPAGDATPPPVEPPPVSPLGPPQPTLLDGGMRPASPGVPPSFEPPHIQQALPPPPVAGTWEAVPVIARPRFLGSVGNDFDQGLSELQPRLSACWDEDTQARFGTQPFSSVAGEPPADDPGSPVFLLELETRSGAIYISDAPVQIRSRASDGLLACLQSVLRGQTIRAPDAKPGARYRWPFTPQR